ncbi:MAG: DUF3006 domain-containing protein [Bacillota bacterium]
MALIIDRFEGNLAVIEYEGKTFTLPRALLPRDAKEGDVLNFTVEVDHDTTEARRTRVKSLEDRLFRK